MPQVKLSILIPTVEGREQEVKRLLSIIKEQTGICTLFRAEIAYDVNVGRSPDWRIEVIIFKDAKELTIGEKREKLYKMANGAYSFMVDDDDSIASDAIEKILAAIDATNPDCVTFFERVDMNGKIQTCNHSLKYDKWRDNWDGFDYVRLPFYKDVIKTEIARSVPFPHIRYNEDEQWSMALKPRLSTESHIDEELYYYSYYPKESHEERYGLNKS